MGFNSGFKGLIPKFICFAIKCMDLYLSGFGGLEVACWPLVPKFAGSHPVEVVGFLG